MKTKMASLRDVATVLHLQPKTVSRWLAALGLPKSGARTRHSFQLDHGTCVVAALFAHLSRVGQAGPNTPDILQLVQLILDGKIEADLRETTVAILAGAKISKKLQRWVFLTGSRELVERHSNNTEALPWQHETDVRDFSFAGTLMLIKLQPLFETIDELFLKNEVAVTK